MEVDKSKITIWKGKNISPRRGMTECVGFEKKYEYGSLIYTYNQMFHRMNGPAVIGDDGTKSWHQYDLLHRDGDLPAIEHNNYKQWWYDGNLHRINGPAIVYNNSEYKEWWYNGKRYTEEMYWLNVLFNEQKNDPTTIK